MLIGLDNYFVRKNYIMADLITTITEEITLPNKNIQRSTNRKVISGVNQINRRLDTITTSFSGTGIEIIRFTNSEEDQVAGSFVRDAVKYIRITNLDNTNYCTIYLIKTDEESTLLGKNNMTDFELGYHSNNEGYSIA